MIKGFLKKCFDRDGKPWIIGGCKSAWKNL